MNAPDQSFHSRREEALDGFRLLLTVLVVMVHSSNLYPGIVQNFIHLGGSFRVPALFALSGFVLYLPTAHLEAVQIRNRAREFWKRRAFRLLPAYWVMLLVASLRCLYVALRAHDPVSQATQLSYIWKGLLWHIPLLHGWSADPMIIVTPDFNVSWTLACECALSAIFPFLISVAFFINTPWGYSAKLLWGHLPDFIPSGYILVFVCGISFARLSRNQALKSNARFINAILILSLGLFLGRFLYLPYMESLANTKLGDGSPWKVFATMLPGIDVWLVGLGVSAFCAYLVLSPQSIFTRVLTLKPVVVLAPLSYGFYLMHVPIFTAWNMISYRLHVAPYGFISLVMSWLLMLVCAYGLHRYVEVPFQRMGKRR
jgi:peptidoglycan/LPS O-acetylase OafA/YrhL